MIKPIHYDDDYESDELLWVKAGEPGETPTIIRQVRTDSSSGSSRDNSGGSTCDGRRIVTVEKGAFPHRNRNLSLPAAIDELEIASKSSSDSRVIVVNVSEQIYPAVVDKIRIQKWKDLHRSPGGSPRHSSNVKNGTHNSNGSKKKTICLKENPRSASQISGLKTKCSPGIPRCASAEPTLPSSYAQEKLIKSRDEGYTSLSEDCKDSDSESIRSKSLPSSWKATHINKNGSEVSLHKFAQKIVSNTSGSLTLHAAHICNNENTKKQRNSRIRHNIENTIEACTCFVCLRSAIYHAQDEDDSDSLLDHPCSCSEPSLKCGGRWAAISVMVLFFPFLLCYPPLKCCLQIHDARKKRKKARKDKRLRQHTKQVNCRKHVL